MSDPVLTPDECKRLRIALIFGDPGNDSQHPHPDPRLETAKAKLLEIERRGAEGA